MLSSLLCCRNLTQDTPDEDLSRVLERDLWRYIRFVDIHSLYRAE